MPNHAQNEIKHKVLMAALPLITDAGFTNATLKQAAITAGITQNDLQTAFPNKAADLVAYFSHHGDSEMRTRLDAQDIPQSIRARIASAVMARMLSDAACEPIVRRALTMLIMPQNQALAARLVWTSADHIWNYFNDPSTDYNYYTKRLILSGVIASTRLAWLDDKTPNKQATQEFINRRINDVMKIETLKANMRNLRNKCPDIIGTLAKLRYRY